MSLLFAGARLAHHTSLSQKGISVQIFSGSLGVGGETLHKKGAVPVTTKNRAAFDTANDDMIQQTVDIETRGTRHERKITEG